MWSFFNHKGCGSLWYQLHKVGGSLADAQMGVQVHSMHATQCDDSDSARWVFFFFFNLCDHLQVTGMK